MKRLKLKRCFIVVYLLFYTISPTYSQCNIEFVEKQKDTFIFQSKDITNPVQCYVRVCLIYSTKYDPNRVGWSRIGIEITDIEVRTKSSNQKLKVFDCSDHTYTKTNAHQCICDTLGKYVRLYYIDPNRTATLSELDTLENNKLNWGKVVKVEECFDSIYIYPNRKNKKK